MTTKEKIVRRSIEEIEAELQSIVSLLDASPLLEIINIRKRAQQLIEGAKDGNQDDLKQIGVLADEEKRQFAIANKQKDTCALIDRRVELEIELDELKNELYWIERKK